MSFPPRRKWVPSPRGKGKDALAELESVGWKSQWAQRGGMVGEGDRGRLPSKRGHLNYNFRGGLDVGGDGVLSVALTSGGRAVRVSEAQQRCAHVVPDKGRTLIKHSLHGSVSERYMTQETQPSGIK